MDDRIFNMCTDVNACDCTWGCMDTCKSLHRKLTPGRKLSGHIRESNLHQQCANPMLYQPSYIPTLVCLLTGTCITSHPHHSAHRYGGENVVSGFREGTLCASTSWLENVGNVPIFPLAGSNRSGHVVQLAQHQTSTPLRQVRFPTAARDLSQRVNFQCRLSYGVCTFPRVCNRMH